MTIRSEPEGNQGTKAEHLAGIDGVRALAALSVVFAHIVGPELPDLLKHTALTTNVIPDLAQYIFTGHPAVIAFFVVSGFCIHYPYINKPLPILPFYIARWIRIMIPALVAMVLAKLARLHDYNFWDGYILWSVVCELCYYMLYPFFLWASRWVSWRKQFYLAMLLSFSIVTVLGTNQFGSAHIYGPFLNWAVALPSWLAGCVLAETIHKTVPFRHDLPPPFFASVIFWRLLVALVASLLYWATMNTSLGYYLTMNGFALLVYFWIRAEVVTKRRSNNTLEWVGQWSYSLYLLHMPLMMIIARSLKHFWSVTLMLTSLPLVLYGTFLLYRKVELPAHAYARRIFRSVNPRGLYINALAHSDSVVKDRSLV